MKPPLSPQEIISIRALRGQQSAADVGLLFDRGAETIRRIWRGEVYSAPLAAAKAAPEIDASLARLAASLNEPPSEDDDEVHP